MGTCFHVNEHSIWLCLLIIAVLFFETVPCSAEVTGRYHIRFYAALEISPELHALSQLKSSMFIDQTRREMRGEGRESASARER